MQPHERIAGVGVVLFCALLFVWGLGDVPFYSKGQPREATVVWEMYHTGEWVLPLRNGHIIPSKPPLFHWLGALASIAAGRLDEFTVRLPSALLALLGVFLTYRTAAAVWGVEAGLVAGLILATSFEWVRAATGARVDMTLAFFMVAALLTFWSGYRGKRFGWPHVLGFFGLAGLATLTKGPVGGVLPGLAVGVFLLVRRDLWFVGRMRPFSGGLLYLCVAGSWYALALWQGGEAFFEKQIMKENVLRFVASETAGAGHVHPFYYFVPNLFMGMAPWSFFFPPLVYFLYRFRGRWARQEFLFPIVWFATVFLFYSASSSKRSVYILPLYPAAALLLGAWWQALRRGEIALPRGFVRLIRAAGYVSAAVIGLAMLGVAAQAGSFDPLGTIRPFLHPKDQSNLPFFTSVVSDHSAAFGCWFLGVGGAMIALIHGLRRQAWGRVFGALVVFTTSMFLLVNHVIQPTIAAARTYRPFMARVVETVGSRPLFFYRCFDSGALYYADRRIPFYSPAITPSEPYYVLASEEDWERLRRLDEGSGPTAARENGTEAASYDADEARLQLLDTSEGTGPKGRRRLTLVEVSAGRALPAWSDDEQGRIKRDAM